MSYYEAISPYLQEYSDEYYLPQEYPMYYPQMKGMNPKYDFYQAMPYYFEDRHMGRDGYYMDQMDPEELQEQLQQEEDRLEREESLPVGQETWYQNDDSNHEDSIDDINAAFLQNLMLYNDALSNKNEPYYPQKDLYNEDLMKTYTEEPNTNKNLEDLDVQELKMLAKPGKKQRKNKNKNKNKKEKVQKEVPNDDWLEYPPKRNQLPNSLEPLPNFQSSTYYPDSSSFSPRKQTLSKPFSSTPPPMSNHLPEKPNQRGQKEFVLIRPATPVRKPFTKPVMDLLNQKNGERKRDPNVYETIKHLLEMEKSLEKVRFLLEIYNFSACFCMFSIFNLSPIHFYLEDEQNKVSKFWGSLLDQLFVV